MNKEVYLVGYSGNALVVCDIFESQGVKVAGYAEKMEKEFNPYNLKYIGDESDDETQDFLSEKNIFVAIGFNTPRKVVFDRLFGKLACNFINAIHKNASISSTAKLGKGNMIGDGCIINACTKIGNSVICNTHSVIEHECVLEDFSHVAPGAILCGDVRIGKGTLVGAGSVIKQCIRIGKNVTIGAGTVVIKDIPDNSTVIGNPMIYI